MTSSSNEAALVGSIYCLRNSMPDAQNDKEETKEEVERYADTLPEIVP